MAISLHPRYLQHHFSSHYDFMPESYNFPADRNEMLDKYKG